MAPWLAVCLCVCVPLCSCVACRNNVNGAVTPQLMEGKSSRRSDINQILPILTDLLGASRCLRSVASVECAILTRGIPPPDPKKHTFAPKDQPSLERLRKWVHVQEEELARLRRSQVCTVLLAWLPWTRQARLTTPW